jgi:imidazolonepropionase-like amidohydrolase
VRSIEHGNLLDEPIARLMAEHDALLVPTLAAYDALDRRGSALGLAPASQAKNLEVLEAGRHAVELAHRAGVEVGFGSDLMGDLADDQLVGIRLQMEVSGTLETLRSATSVNAEVLRRKDLGVVAVGAVGDLVLWGGNPLEDPALVWDESRERTVIQGGSVVR